MPRISKVVNDSLTLRYGWLFDIQSDEELFEYLDNVRTPRAKKELSDALLAAQGMAHDNHIAFLAKMRGISVIDAQTKFNADLFDAMTNIRRREGRIFVNNVGGYFYMSKGVVASETKEIDVWALPEEKPRFIQWPGGKHWYAKIGDEDIVVDDIQKWNTKKEAEAAAESYLKGKRR